MAEGPKPFFEYNYYNNKRSFNSEHSSFFQKIKSPTPSLHLKSMNQINY